MRSTAQAGRPLGRLVLFAAALCVGCSSAAFAQTAGVVAKQVDTHYNHLRSLQCRYAERYQRFGFTAGQARTETGTLTLQKPGRMRWAYDTPAGKLFILDGKIATAYTPGDPQATRLSEKQLDDLRSPLRFLLGHTYLTKELDALTLSLVSDAPRLYNLSGAPKAMVGNAADRLRMLTLTVDAAGLIHTMRLEQADGSLTIFDFTACRENLPTTPADFTFIAPAGVTIVSGEPPI